MWSAVSSSGVTGDSILDPAEFLVALRFGFFLRFIRPSSRFRSPDDRGFDKVDLVSR